MWQVVTFWLPNTRAPAATARWRVVRVAVAKWNSMVHLVADRTDTGLPGHRERCGPRKNGYGSSRSQSLRSIGYGSSTTVHSASISIVERFSAVYAGQPGWP